MEKFDQKKRTYRFHFMKEHFWIWALFLPFGLICWALPFVIFRGLQQSGNSPAWFPYFGFVFLGIPCYMIGWIFVYSLMEGIYTRVAFTNDVISTRLPSLILPLIPVEKTLELHKVQRMDLFARYGTRLAVFLYYLSEGRERRFYIPRFKHNPAYDEELRFLRDRFG